MRLLKKILPILVILIFSFFAVAPLFNLGFFTFHDNIQVQRVYEMTKAIGDGMFPVRWSMDLGFGYGYPMFNYYAPLAYYVASAFSFIGFSAIISTKIIIILGVILSAISMYILTKVLFGKIPAIFASVLYIFAPYHAVDIYVRGDIAETWGYIFIPLVFYSLLKIYKEDNKIFWIIGSLAYFGLIISHNLTALMATPFIIAFIIFLSILSKNKHKSITLFFPIIGGVILSAFYWLPTLGEINFTNVISQVGGGADYKDHFVCLHQLWSGPWGFGGSVQGCVDGLSFVVGKLHIFYAVLSIAVISLALYFGKVSRKSLSIVLFFLSCGLFSLFLTLEASKPIWDTLRPMAFFQFPWRFLILASFFLSFVGASGLFYLLSFFKLRVSKLFILFILCISLLVTYTKLFVPQQIFKLSDKDYTSQIALNWIASNISSEYMPKKFSKPTVYKPKGVDKIITSKDISAEFLSRKTQQIKISINAKRQGEIIVPLAYFPAWKAYINNRQINIKEEKNGISILVPSGNYDLILEFRQTQLELLGDFLTLAGVFAIIAGIITIKFKYEKTS